MNEFLLTWLALCSIHLIAVASPGPAFAVCVRNSIVHNRKAGIITAIGLGQGVGLHILLVLTGMSLILTQFPYIFAIIQYAGAAYLIYIGLKALLAKPSEHMIVNAEKKAQIPEKTSLSFIIQGFITNALNPKAWVFFTAVFSQFISATTPLGIIFLYGITVVAVETMWFIMLSLFLTHTSIRNRFLAISHWIERICGGLLVTLGVKLAISKI